MNYILNENREPVPVEDILEWAKWFEKADRVVRKTPTPNGEVSTVFLGIDHRFAGDGPPILWETMIFGGSHDQDQRRYTSEADAIRGHEQMVLELTK